MSISFVQGLSDETVGLAHELYMSACAEGSVCRSTDSTQPPLALMPVSRETVAYWFTGAGRHTLLALDDERPVGMISGTEDANRRCGYLSFLYVSPARRGQGLGTRLMQVWEDEMSACADVDKLEAVFYCPVHLPWYIPNQAEPGEVPDASRLDWHPCVPGVDVASGLYRMLKNRGYRDFAIQNAYHQKLAGYVDPPALARTRERLLSEGIELTMYDETRHRGLAELFDNIKNPGWKAQVMAHTDRLIVVAVDHNADELVVSYTGPLSVDGTPGRGNFCGIGTRTEYRGRGIGKLVFCEMCRRHAAAGAEFMTLYTGENNPARNIYEAAGFRIARTFADMRKELKKL